MGKIYLGATLIYDSEAGGASVLTGDAVVGEVLDGKFFYSDDPDTKLEGTMPDNADADVEVVDVDGTAIPEGYYDGTGLAVLSAAEAAKVVAGNIKDGVTILGVEGTLAGSSVLTGDAVVGEVLATKTFYKDDPASKLTGTMTNRGAVSTDISAVATEVAIASGYHNGSGVVKIAAADQAKLITANIKAGITVLGVAGATNVVDTTTGDAVAGEILSGKKAWVDGAEVAGTRGSDSYTKAMLHMDGANNGTTFTDETGKTWTPHGDAKTSTTQKGYGTASAYFDGNGDYLTASASADFEFGTGDFTIEAWVYMAAPNTGDRFIWSGAANSEIFFGFTGANIGVGRAAVAWDKSEAHGMVANTWNHVAVTRTGTSLRLFVNGVQKGAADSNSQSYNISATPYIGSQGTNYYYTGYIDELRVTKGLCRYIDTFAPGAPFDYHV